MEVTLKSKVAEKFSKDDASFISEVLSEIDNRQSKQFEAGKELFLTQRDKVELIDRIQGVEKTLTKTIYVVGLVQFLAIITSVLAIFNFMLK